MYHCTIIDWPLTSVSMYKHRPPQEFQGDHPQGLGVGYVVSLAREMHGGGGGESTCKHADSISIYEHIYPVFKF